MQKELEPIRQLETRRDSLSNGIGRINDIYLSDPMRIGKVEAGSSISNSLEVGRTKAAARKAVVALGNKLEEVDNDLRANDEARDYLHKVNEMERGLAEMRELVAGGNLPEDILRKHQQEFEELQKLPENNLLLQRAIERIRREEAKRKRPSIDVLPDRKVRLPDGREVGGKQGEALILLKDTSEDNTKDTDHLVQEIWPGVEDKIGRDRLSVLLSDTRRELIGSGLELVNITPPIERTQGVTGRYYLGRVDQDEQLPKTVYPEEAEDKSDEGFRFEDVQVVTGEEGKILRKLSPFDPHHIVSRQELTQALSSEGVPIEPQNFDQHLGQVRDILDWRRYRLCELPNAKDPDNAEERGYYVEAVRRQQVNITLLGDTVRYRDRQNQTKEVRLSESQYRLLWQLSSGEPKLDKDLADKVSDVPNLDLVRATADSLNSKLTDLTSAEGIVISVGDENFGDWYKIKDTRIARRLGYLPLHSTRKEALKLIFQDDPATTKEEIINTLGPTRGKKRMSQPLNSYQAAYALRNSVRSLSNRTRENMATDDEATLYQGMQDYIAKHNLTDERDLTRYIAENKLGISRAPSTTEDIDYSGQTDGEDVGEGDSGVASLPRMTEEIETPEFGILSKADVALITERLQFNRVLLGSLLQQRGVRLIEEDVIYELMDLVQGQEIGLKEQYYQGLISEEEFNQLMNEYRARAFEKAREMLKDPNFGENVDRIGDQNSNVWGLFVNLSEINEVIERSGHEEGISLLAQNPEVLKDVLESPENEDGIIEDDIETSSGDKPTIENKPADGYTTVFEAPSAVGVEPIKPKPSALERRDPDIIATINNYLDNGIETIGIDNDFTSVGVASKFPKLKRQGIENGVGQRWISPKYVNGTYRFNVVDVVTLMYLSNEGKDLPPQLKKRVQEIAQEEYRKRLKERENDR